MLPVHTILHPTDFSEHADYAYRLACVIARECGAHLIVLHVAGPHIEVPHPIHTEIGIAFDCSGDYESRHAALKAQLHERFETNPEIRVETRLIYGAPAAEILRMAEEAPCDLIVMGTHGRTGVNRLLAGSVAEEVMRKAHCPLLTVRDPKPAPVADNAGSVARAAIA